MNQKLQTLLTLLEDNHIPFEERYHAAMLIAAEIGSIEEVQIPVYYQALVKFWKSLGLRSIDRADGNLFVIRKLLAGACETLSRRLPGGRTFFAYFPSIPKVEGPHFSKKNETMSGALGYRNVNVGSSIYEFHWEYPIEGFGVKKDLISVIMDGDRKMPIFDWCEENHIIVFCNRCGLDITFEVSKNCPWRKRRYEVH